MQTEEQRLLAKILDLFSQKFGNKAVLRGGMVLRILGSARLTNDLDYVFVPYKSKNDIVKEILECLKTIESAEINHSLNSKGLRVNIKVGDTRVQVEAKVALEMKTIAISTSLYSPKYELPKRVIHVVDHSISLANKMAAWNERRLIRDVFDIWYFLSLDVLPNREVLEKRLKKPQYSRAVSEEEYFQGKDFRNFYKFYKAKVKLITQDEIKEALGQYLPTEDLIGLEQLFKASLIKLT